MRKTQIANKETPRYDGRCLNLTEDEIQAKLAAGEPYVVRLKVPTEGLCVFEDELRGEVSIDWKQIDHQILQKSDGYPTYHLANVVDDHLMGITHVIRGEEWISSTPKHVLLYQALGWEPPVFAHLPLLRNPDKSKLSKRKNPTGIFYYREAGFLPEAMINYLGMMGYTLPDQREIFSLNELSESFDLKRMSLGGPIFDLAKLKWLNGRYLREKLSPEEVVEAPSANGGQPGLHRQGSAPRPAEVGNFCGFLSSRPVFTHGKSGLFNRRFGGQIRSPRSRPSAQNRGVGAGKSSDLGPGLPCPGCFKGWPRLRKPSSRICSDPFFFAISGSAVSLPLFDGMTLLGPDLSRVRLRKALNQLSESGVGLSKKGLKALEKEYRSSYGERID